MAKKVAMRKAKAVKMPSPKDLAPASYNPRKMSDESRSSLKRSMEEFQDISGITWNKKTNNIVTGHHRWQSLIDLHGLENLDFKQLADDKYSIVTKDGEDTSFIMRVVDWDLGREKAANVAANSQTLTGQFTIELQDVLGSIEDEFSDLFHDLRFEDLKIDFNFGEKAENNADEWSSDIGRIDKLNSDEREMFDTITVLVSKTENLAKVKEKVQAAVEGCDAKVK